MTTSGNGVPGNRSRAHVVSQDELGEYHSLKRQSERLGEELKERRLRLIERIKGGAAIAPGFFDAVVREYEQRNLTADKLADLLGPDKVEWLKCQVAPTHRTDLWVTSKP